MNASTGHVPRWHVAEITLASRQSYDNPYRDVTVVATFSGPDGQVIARDAFWDGTNIWKARFAPTAVGAWHWKTSCSDAANKELHNRTGTIACGDYTGALLIFKHGFIRIGDTKRNFTYADGTPFFWLGDTHWQMPDTERVDACNHPDHAVNNCPFGGQFQHLLADRQARGFTVYQTYPAATRSHWWTTPYSQLNPDRFRDVFDAQMNRLAEQGFVIALGCGHFADSLRMPVDDLRRWARYLVARYGAHPVVWITCQEINAPEQNKMDSWLAVAREIALADGYGHPHSAHQWVCDVTTRPLGREPWHDWFALQGGHRGVGLTPQARYKGYYDFQPTRPIIETEAMYERVDCGGVNTTDDARISAWKAMLCGSAGYTYGAAGVWALKWNAKDTAWTTYNHDIDSWHAGMVLPGATQMTVLKSFFASFDWRSLTPRFNDHAWSEWRDSERSVLATEGNRLYLAYFYGATATGTLKRLDSSALYRARWFDPRKGEFASDPVMFRPENGCFEVPEKPTAQDWVLSLEK